MISTIYTTILSASHSLSRLSCRGGYVERIKNTITTVNGNYSTTTSHSCRCNGFRLNGNNDTMHEVFPHISVA